MATQAGKVTHRDDFAVVVTYEDGTVDSTPIGSQYGTAEGTSYLHPIVSPLRQGDDINEGDVIAYNTNFFEPDWLNPNVIVYKTQFITPVALTVSNDVHEDSCSISEETSRKFRTQRLKNYDFVFEFNKNLLKMVKVGDEVGPYTPLFFLTESEVEETNLKEDTIKLLKTLGGLAPKAKVNGVVDKIEIFYNGDVGDMSPSLKKVVKACDSQLSNTSYGSENPYTSGKVTSDYRVKGRNLMLDTIHLRILIRIPSDANNGDKGVFGAQLKTVISHVYTHGLTTESGIPVGGVFGAISLKKRIVNSPFLMGTTNRLLLEFGKMVADTYFE